MYLALLTLTLLAGLNVARWLAEPSCPGCSAKSWMDTPQHLECTECGWSNAAKLPIAAESLVPTDIAA